MTSPSPGVNRIKADVLKLIDSKHDVTVLNNINEFVVRFNGPQNTPYAGGVWRVRVDLPEKYPFKSPSIGFTNRIFHPNIDEISGTVCLDVINQTWSPMYDLTNVFETFLPQLLAYPNPSDPLNGDAAALFIHRPEEFKKTVKEYVRKYASEESPPVEASSSAPNFSHLLTPGTGDQGGHAATEIESSVTRAVSEVSTMHPPNSGVAAPPMGIISDDDDVFEGDVLETFPSPPPVTIDLMSSRTQPLPNGVPGESSPGVGPATGRLTETARVPRPFRGARRNLERIISRHQTILQRRLNTDASGPQWPQPIGTSTESASRASSGRRWTIVLDEGEKDKKTTESETGTKKRRRCITLPCSLENISDESDMSDFEEANI